MTILQFPSTKRAQLEQLAAELGALIIWPDLREKLTPREEDALARLGRIPRPTQSIAVDLFVSARGAHYLLSALVRKGYAARVGKHVGGGWVAVSSTVDTTSNALDIAA